MELRVNTLGDAATRTRYTSELTEFFRAYAADLSPTAHELLAKGNPLRILDSKHAGDQAVAARAPTVLETATAEARSWFADIQDGLACAGVPFVVDKRIVRGLEYYTGTVWEFVTSALGSQNAVIAGGRYDNLVAELSRGKPMPVSAASLASPPSIPLEAYGSSKKKRKPFARVMHAPTRIFLGGGVRWRC